MSKSVEMLPLSAKPLSVSQTISHLLAITLRNVLIPLPALIALLASDASHIEIARLSIAGQRHGRPEKTTTRDVSGTFPVIFL